MSTSSSSQIITDGATEKIVSSDAAMLLTWSGLPKLQPWRQSPCEDGRPAIAIQLGSGSEVATISTSHDCLKALQSASDGLKALYKHTPNSGTSKLRALHTYGPSKNTARRKKNGASNSNWTLAKDSVAARTASSH